ncbi:MAG: hypothetical protein CM1200mP3_04180 [Chloroflexota bacterium]|nr:MAG: hypothetical protein CM1200mP3_04180 [Chloroflexota bacterium]
MVSYEIPFIMSILTVAVLANAESRANCFGAINGRYILIQPMAFFIFLTSGLAELGRTPFDIHHAESEVVGGHLLNIVGSLVGILSC